MGAQMTFSIWSLVWSRPYMCSIGVLRLFKALLEHNLDTRLEKPGQVQMTPSILNPVLHWLPKGFPGGSS